MKEILVPKKAKKSRKFLKISLFLVIFAVLLLYTYKIKSKSEKIGVEWAEGRVEYFQNQLDRHIKFREYVIKKYSELDTNSYCDDALDVSDSQVALSSNIDNTCREIEYILDELNTNKFVFDSKSKTRIYIIRRDLEKIKRRSLEQKINKF